MPQVVLLHILDRNTSSEPSHEQDPRKLNALTSRVLRAALLMLNEQSNMLTNTEKPTTSKADLPDLGPHRTQARQPRVPCDIGP